MKFRTDRKLILSIIFAILTFFKVFFSNFLKNVRVGRYSSLFIFFFRKAIKIAGSAHKNGVSGNTGFLFFWSKTNQLDLPNDK